MASYLLLASLTIWCARNTATAFQLKTGPQIADGPSWISSTSALLRIVEPALASLPHVLGSLACLVAGLALCVGAPFDLRYAAVGALAVALYLTVVNLAYLIEDWQRGVPLVRMLCVRSLLPACFAAPMLMAGLRLMAL